MEKMSKCVVAAAQADEPSWEELLGSNNWEGLLDPLDLSLRRFILRCGDFCQCTGDAFNNDKNSDYYGSSRYGKKSFFDKVKFEFAANYQVSSFLYATAVDDVGGIWDMETNFMGYIAVSTDTVSQISGRREIYVVWRGTETIGEWFIDAHFLPVSAAPLLPAGTVTDPVPRVMHGWLKIYTSSNPNSSFTKLSAREQLQAKLRQLIEEEYKDEKVSIVVTGHSLGAALAILSAFDLVENVVSESDIPVAVLGFGCPLVGDGSFAERVQRHTNLHILRINNKLDIVPKCPPEMLGYTAVGEEIEINGMVSPFLETSKNQWHNLQGILHVVAGWHGPTGKFEVVVKRSLALVNKDTDFLKDEYKIPASWWVIENKGMVLDDKGDWILAPPDDEDIPVPEF